MPNETVDVSKKSQSQSFLGGLLSGGSDLVGGVVDATLGSWARRRQRQFQREMANTAYQRDMEMWNTQNLYNSPVEQMKRLESAGLNPNLVYGKGADNVATQMPKYHNYETPVHVPQLSFGQAVTSAIGTYQDFRMKEAQIQHMRQQNQVLAQQAQLTSLRAGFYPQELFSKLDDRRLRNLKHRYEFGEPRYVLDPDMNPSYRGAIQDTPFTSRYSADVNRLQLDNNMKRLELKLKQMGVTWQDSALVRLLMSDQDMNSKLLPMLGLGLSSLGKAKMPIKWTRHKFNVTRSLKLR
jgi:hypothetical protein